MSMLPKAARPFGTKIWVVGKNGETQKAGLLTMILIMAIIKRRRRKPVPKIGFPSEINIVISSEDLQS